MRVFPAIRLAVLVVLAVPLHSGDALDKSRELIQQYRNLGKAFYENPTTQDLAVDEFRAALELSPDSARERVNYGLALLRAAKTEDGLRELQIAQKQDPAIPHTWFNLGIAYKKDGQSEMAIAQFEGMLRLVPNEPVTHYNLGVLYKLAGKLDSSLEHFETSAKLNPNLAGPHFQLYNAYRQRGRAGDADHEQEIFQAIKKRTAGAAIPEDLEWSFYSEIYDTVDPIGIGDKGPPPRTELTPVRLGTGVDATSAGIVLADVDGDGHADVLVWSSLGIQVFRNGGSPMDCGLAGLKGVIFVAPGDWNNDGWADLAVLTSEGAALYLNRNGKFELSPIKLPHGHFRRAVWLDFDHDYDLDLVLLGETSALARNNGAAGFSDETARFPFVKGNALDAVTIDTFPDTQAIDLAVTYADRSGVLYTDKLAANYEVREIASIPPGATGVSAHDFNNDGWTDLAIATDAGALQLRNDAGTFQATATIAGNAKPVFADLGNRGHSDLVTGTVPALVQAVAVAASDFDDQGATDLIAVNRDGSVERLQNTPKSENHWLTVALTGVKNLKLAYGSVVELKAGTLYQKQTYRGVPLHFGLSGRAEIDTLRITWPNGLVQNQMKPPVGKPLVVKEAPRLSGSCPMIFTWNGEEFEFVTDVLGVAPLGAGAGDGHYFPVDHDEYVQIPAGALVARQEEYEVRITEELHEVSYLDQARLIAVDHPRDIEIFTNDKFKSPPFPEFRIFGARNRIYPSAAQDQSGGDVLPLLLKRDGAYVDTFEHAPDGTAEMHSLDMTFEESSTLVHPVLVLSGWVDWADGSTFVAASQEKPGGLVMPYLQAKDAQGVWRTIVEDLGMPAGKPKTIAVDLTGKIPSGTREFRILTNLCLYWDQISLIDDVLNARPTTHTRISGLAPSSADLHFRGFSKVVLDPQRRQPERFLYQSVAPVSQWNPVRGMYTRYGDVRTLIRSLDDRLVILGSGDEMTLKFPSTALPSLAAGWTREFLLLVDGWAKDADANTAFSTSVEPLPFHGMTAYPYPAGEHFPGDLAHRAYQEQYNFRPALRLTRPLTE